MSKTGIGQSVRRVEDFRFITGSGQYTADINRPAQSYAVFVRSPHAHATIKSHRHREGGQGAGCARCLHREAPCRRQDRRADLRLDDPLQGRIADEGRCASRARARKGALCRRSRRRRHRRNAQSGARRSRARASRLRCARAVVDLAARTAPGQATSPRGSAEQYGLPVASRRQGRGRCRIRQSKATSPSSSSPTIV